MVWIPGTENLAGLPPNPYTDPFQEAARAVSRLSFARGRIDEKTDKDNNEEEAQRSVGRWQNGLKWED